MHIYIYIYISKANLYIYICINPGIHTHTHACTHTGNIYTCIYVHISEPGLVHFNLHVGVCASMFGGASGKAIISLNLTRDRLG